LMMLEQLYGRAAFDEFLNGHFRKYAFGTVTTDLFLADLKAFHEQQVALNSKLLVWRDFEPLVLAWVDGEGLPNAQVVGGFPKLESKEFERVEQQVSQYFASGEPLHRGSSIPCDASVIDTSGFTTHHWLHLLRKLHTRADGSPGRLSREEMAGLDARFHFTQTQNAEIACDWFVLSIQSDYRPAYQAMHDFLLKVGRRKFLMPIYEALLAQFVVKDGKYEPAFAQGKEMATEIFLQAEPGYHSVAARSLRELLGLPLTGGSGR
ncbi:MAG: leukotriene A4 hydrolase C-terminal domain-containing protein, partial [Bacteroidia bacterium]